MKGGEIVLTTSMEINIPNSSCFQPSISLIKELDPASSVIIILAGSCKEL